MSTKLQDVIKTVQRLITYRMDVDVMVVYSDLNLCVCVLDSRQASVLLPKSRVSQGGGDGEGQSSSSSPIPTKWGQRPEFLISRMFGPVHPPG